MTVVSLWEFMATSVVTPEVTPIIVSIGPLQEIGGVFIKELKQGHAA